MNTADIGLDCNACMSHYVGNRTVVELACNSASNTLGGPAHKWMRHYFARFHDEGHRRVV